MWSLLKFLIFLTLIAIFLWFGTHVRMGKYTLFGHISRIWSTPEAQDLVKGVREGSGPAIDKMKRGVKAGVDEATRDDDAGPVDAAPRLEQADKKAPSKSGAKTEADAGARHRKSHKKPDAAGI